MNAATKEPVRSIEPGPRHESAIQNAVRRGSVHCPSIHLTGPRHVTALQMTRSDSRGIPARPRVARRTNGVWTQSLLNDWEHLVKRAESGAAAHLTGCPQCDGDDGLDARDELEALIRRGGKRGLRISQRVRVLDERFIAATTPSPFAPQGAGWWRHRNLD